MAQNTLLIVDAMSPPEEVAIPGARPSLKHGYRHGAGNPQPFVSRQHILFRLCVSRENLHWRGAERFGARATIQITCRGTGRERV